MLVCFLLRAAAGAPEAVVPASGTSTTLNCFTHWDHSKDWPCNSKILYSKIMNTHNFKAPILRVLSTVIHSFHLEWFRKTLLCKNRCRQVNVLGLKQGWEEKILSACLFQFKVKQMGLRSVWLSLFDFTLEMNEDLHYHALPPAEIFVSWCPYLHIRSMNQEMSWVQVVHYLTVPSLQLQMLHPQHHKPPALLEKGRVTAF